MLLFILGFFSFPLLLFVIIRLFSYKIKPNELNNINDIQDYVRKLYSSKRLSAIYLLDYETNLDIRINKKQYKNGETPFELEIRFNQNNRNSHKTIIEELEQKELKYRERKTPKLQLPSRIFVKFDTGIYSISEIGDLLDKIYSRLFENTRYKVFADHRDSIRWGIHT